MNLKQEFWRIPFLELIVIALGLTGIAGRMSVFWLDSHSLWNGPWEQTWWTSNCVVVGVIALVVSLFSDLISGRSLKSAVAIGLVGIIGLVIFYTFAEPGDIGLGLFWLLGAACVLSGVSSLIRRTLAGAFSNE